MQKVRIEMTKEQIDNLISFLDRVSYRGFREIGLIQEIMVALQSPVHEKENEISD